MEGSLAEENQEGTCVICTDDINKGDKILMLRCKHYFHADCVKDWLIVKLSCPYCRESKNIF